MTQTQTPPPPLATVHPLNIPRHQQRARALDLEARIEDGLATHTRRFRCGEGLFNFDFARSAAMNVLRVGAGVPWLDPATLIEFTDQLQAGLPQRSVRVVDDERASQLRPAFAAAGWSVETLTLMTPRRLPDRPVDVSTIEPVEIDELLGARQSTLRNQHRELDTAEELLAAGALAIDGMDLRCFAAKVGQEVAAYAVARVAGEVARVTELDALARSHGQGLGRAAIWGTVKALRQEGVRLVVVETEDDTWPKWTLRRLGFEELGHTHRFVRPWGDESAPPPAS